MSVQPTDSETFSALQRVYGAKRAELLPQLHICVVGIGGVGSWAAEALARTGVGHITLLDPDDIVPSNINRQVHALHSTVGASKVAVMRERILDISPDCRCTAHEDLLVENNLQRYISPQFNYVIDAIDSIRFKAALINYCRRAKIRIITTGGAGGRVDPLAVTCADLSRTWNDALAAKVRARLRANYGYTKNPKRRFAVECIFSTEQPVYPTAAGGVSQQKPGVPGATLDCESGYGSTCPVTAAFGLMAAAKSVNNALARMLRHES